MPASLSRSSATHQPEKRDVKKVPFVELHAGRLQGVVSSGSDIQRVYVSYFEARTMDYHCSTNNNRPCGGLRGTPCKHLQDMLVEAIKQHGIEKVVAYLQLPADTTTDIRDMLKQANKQAQQPAGEVFSRFLAYLQLLEYPVSDTPLPEMDWFGV